MAGRNGADETYTLCTLVCSREIAGNKSRVSREAQARFCERVWGKFLRSTRPINRSDPTGNYDVITQARLGLGSFLAGAEDFISPLGLAESINDPLFQGLMHIGKFGASLAIGGFVHAQGLAEEALLAARTPATLDTNVLIYASKSKEYTKTVNTMLKEGNMKAQVAPESAREFVQGGHQNMGQLRNVMSKLGAKMGPNSEASQTSMLREAGVKASDARITSSSMRSNGKLISNDGKLINILERLGINNIKSP